MKLGHYLERIEDCSGNGPLHCALSRTSQQGCWIQAHHPNITQRAFEEQLVQYWHPNPGAGFKRRPCIRLTKRGKVIRKQLKGDFT